MASKLEIWNMALGQIRAEDVADPDESSKSAKECRLHWPQALKTMLERSRLSVTTRRVTLAEVENDRPFEWLYAYALPSDMAAAIHIIPDYDALGLALPVALPGDPYAETWAVNPGLTMPYAINGGILYTNAGGASLDYSLSDIDLDQLPALVVDALALDLATRLAVPIKDDKDLKASLMKEARMAWETALAEDRNRQPETYGDYVSEAAIARMGG